MRPVTIAAFLLLLFVLDGLAGSSLANLGGLCVAPAKHVLPGAPVKTLRGTRGPVVPVEQSGASVEWSGKDAWTRGGVASRPEAKRERRRHDGC